MKYNLSQIMKDAHRTYRVKKGTMSFSECLKRAWKIAKMQAITSDCIEEGNKKFSASMKDLAKNSLKATRCDKYNDLNIPASAFYSGSKGYMGASYVGD